MSIPRCIHNNGPDCAKCEALDIPDLAELERGYHARIAQLEAELAAAEAEAERWRCFVEQASIAWFSRNEEIPEDSGVYQVTALLSFPAGRGTQPERLDAAIDAMRGPK